jgi:hypothetical protein
MKRHHRKMLIGRFMFSQQRTKRYVMGYNVSSIPLGVSCAVPARALINLAGISRELF